LIGINFADREYFTELLTTQRPILSAVFTGRGGVFAPIAARNPLRVVARPDEA